MSEEWSQRRATLVAAVQRSLGATAALDIVDALDAFVREVAREEIDEAMSKVESAILDVYETLAPGLVQSIPLLGAMVQERAIRADSVRLTQARPIGHGTYPNTRHILTEILHSPTDYYEDDPSEQFSTELAPPKYASAATMAEVREGTVRHIAFEEGTFEVFTEHGVYGGPAILITGLEPGVTLWVDQCRLCGTIASTSTNSSRLHPAYEERTTMADGDWTAPGHFDPSGFEHGIVCGWCHVPLTEGNVMQQDITGSDPEPWEGQDQPRVVTYGCVDCVLRGVVQQDPDAQEENDG